MFSFTESEQKHSDFLNLDEKYFEWQNLKSEKSFLPNSEHKYILLSKSERIWFDYQTLREKRFGCQNLSEIFEFSYLSEKWFD